MNVSCDFQVDSYQSANIWAQCQMESSHTRKGDVFMERYHRTSETEEAVIEEYEGIIKAAIGSLPVQEILLSDSKNLIIRLRDDATRGQLEQLKPKDSELLAAVSDVIGVAVTLKGLGKDDCLDSDGNSYDFMSRYFAPWFGVSEDPVCGSIHCALGPYWAKVLQKNVLYARQCSSRGGDLLVKLVSDRTLINGDAVIVVEGQINL
ncbi:phenazine biosynthesis-like domain-containing protein 2 [Stegodyphus dumicola]|uniref:phenazine biosynthesis-like domain-containing protein 2 n=1 Tax=Stegodyphus dumicola TaxID=202533 RepID=UPI0015AE2032|nr:phenazine biosynthesis-like domain-containing protein 2 [Stegodyphus dumicola]